MKYSVKIGLHAPNKEAAEAPIRLRVSWAGKRADVRSGYVIAPDKWDAGRSCVRLGARNRYGETAARINRALMELADKAGEVLTLFALTNHRPPSVAEFKEAFDEATGRSKPAPAIPGQGGLFAALDTFMREMGTANNWAPPTFTKFRALRLHLYQFNPDLTLEGFTKATFASFVAYLQTKAEQVNSTVSKNVGFLRWFLRWADDNGLYSGDAHRTYRPRFKGLDCKEVVYLEWEELHHFLAFDFGKRQALARVRDVFCFCAFTSLRYSDVAKLRAADVHLDASPPYISVVTKKTTDRLRIELNRYALALLERYRGKLDGDKVLPVVSNPKTNEYLHKAAEVAGIDSPVRVVQFVGNDRREHILPKHAVLTSHAGRRTFIVNAIRLGVPAPVIMEWTGHSDYKAMKPYIKIVDAAKADNMAKFDTYAPGPAQSGTPENEAPEKVPENSEN